MSYVIEDHTVSGELERIIKQLGESQCAVFRDAHLQVKRCKQERKTLLDSLDHYSFQDEMSFLFNLPVITKDYYLVLDLKDEEKHKYRMSLDTAKYLLSALVLPFPDTCCFVRFGEDSDLVVGIDANRARMYSMVVDPKRGKHEDVPKWCTAMVILGLRNDPKDHWVLASISDGKINFPIVGYNHRMVERYFLKGIFPKTDSVCINGGLDALQAPIAMLSCKRSDEPCVTQSHIFRDMIDAEAALGNKEKLRNLAKKSPTISASLENLLHYLFEGKEEEPFTKRLMKCLYFLIYNHDRDKDYEIPVFWMSLVSILAKAMEDGSLRDIDVVAKPDWDDPLLIQKISMIKYCSEYENVFTAECESEYSLELHPNRKIIIPSTQTSAGEPIMTSDQFEEYEKVLQKYPLEERNRLHTKPLLSDMQAFKAANPDCTLVDFIQWHSPKDIMEGGVLSERMRNGSIWASLWEEATPCPVSEQPPLFDSQKEAKKALFYLEDMDLCTLYRQLGCYFEKVFDIEAEISQIEQDELGRFGLTNHDEVLLAGEEERELIQSFFTANLLDVYVFEDYYAFDSTMLLLKNGKQMIAKTTIV